MLNHVQNVLARWYPSRHEFEWVLGTVIRTQGSSYRKAGAMTLINHEGLQLGLLSGGCLERDLRLQAQKVLHSGKPVTVIYDATEDSDIVWQLGLGCGGKVTIYLQALTASNQYLQLEKLFTLLEQGNSATYRIDTRDFSRVSARTSEHITSPPNTVLKQAYIEQDSRANKAELDDDKVIHIPVSPQKNIVIFGGGVDAIPMVSIAAQLGWQTTLVDHRNSYAREEDFPQAKSIIRLPPKNLARGSFNHVDAAIIMTHNIDMDAAALLSIKETGVRYLGLLGPDHRKQKVLHRAGIKEHQLPVKINGPMGINIGGELPESIALSTLAQCHAALELKQTGEPHLQECRSNIGRMDILADSRI